MATLKDIAKQCGLNVSTVSRAINDSDDIKDETKKIVLKAARELNYFPNKQNGLLAEKKTSLIGVIAPEIMSGFYAKSLLKIEQMISDEGYSVLTGFTNFDVDEEIRFMNMFANKAVEGIIVISSNEGNFDRHYEFKQKNIHLPIIQVNSVMSLDFYDCLTIDEKLSMKLTLKHLNEQGHRRVAFIGDKYATSRRDYFLETAKDFDMDVEELIANIGEERFEEGGYLRMKEVLALKQRPTAVIASYDNVAIGAMRAIYEEGLRIPEDISIVGHDDIRESSFLYKALTTISVPINEMARIATQILFKKIKDVDFDVIQHVDLKPSLMIRETVAKI